jgi:hypothetical protein
LTCEGEFDIFRNGQCVKDCLEEELLIIKYKSCINVKNCISTLNLDAPPMFSIEKDFFSVNLNLGLKPECDIYRDEIESNIKIEYLHLYVYNGSPFKDDGSPIKDDFKSESIRKQVEICRGKQAK